MNRNRDRAAQPSRMTDADRKRQAAAIAAHDARIARARRKERIARFACIALVVGAMVAIFLKATNGV